MTITNERAELLAQYLNADEERAKKLFETEAEEAVALINKDGFDFTVEELAAFAELMEKMSVENQEELSEDMLTNTDGGCHRHIFGRKCPVHNAPWIRIMLPLWWRK